MRNLLKTLSLVCLLCASQTADAQFNTVGTSRKVAAVQSTGRLRADHVTVTVEGEVIEPVRKDTLAANTLSNINHQNSGVTKPVQPPVQQLGSASAPADSTRTEPRHLLCTPLKQLTVSSPFGMRKDPFTGKQKFHQGTDYLTASENVYAMMPGRIKKIDYDRKLGNYIVLEHGEFVVTYAHLHTVVGRKGDTVKAGQSVGISGSTGRSTGDHLHVSIRYHKKPIDPDPLIRYIQRYITDPTHPIQSGSL